MEEIKDREMKRLFERYEETLTIYNEGVHMNAPWYVTRADLVVHNSSKEELIKHLNGHLVK